MLQRRSIWQGHLYALVALINDACMQIFMCPSWCVE